MSNVTYWPTYTSPDAAESDILTSGFAVNVPVTVALAVPIVNVVGFVDVELSAAPVPETLHELKLYPAAGVAVMDTCRFSTTVLMFGDFVNVPELAGDALMVSVCPGIVK